ncbi:MAG: ribulose-phosphate 3-epimerase [Candidatus Paceibacterota bacterium]
MLVIPAINEVNFEEVLKKIDIAGRFSRWVHLDVVDGEFAANTTWNNPGDLKAVNSGPKADIEVHLMVEHPETVIGDWASAGAKRIIIHLEALGGKEFKPAAESIEMGLSINPETPVEDLLPYLENFKFVLILGVNPGLAGQKFEEEVLEKIKFLKNYYPGVIIEADGGINLETAGLVKEAGADILVSASYIWKSQNPEQAYKELTAL